MAKWLSKIACFEIVLEVLEALQAILNTIKSA